MSVQDDVEIIFNGKLVLLYDNRKQTFVESTLRISRIYHTYWYGSEVYKIYFVDSDRFYIYNLSNVKFLKFQKESAVSGNYFVANNTQVDPMRVELYEGNYAKFYFQNGVCITTNNYKILQKGNSERLFSYFSSLADYGYSIADVDEPLHYLTKTFSKMSFNPESVLRNYFSGTFDVKSHSNKKIILPFNYNISQYEAIQTAFKNNISIVEGPPGTGKTETILNLISNIVIDDKTIAVISNNNNAIDNVYSKLQSSEYSFICANLGNMDRREDFFNEIQESESKLHDFLNSNPKKTSSDTLTNINDCWLHYKRINQYEIDISRLRQELENLEKEYFKQPFVKNKIRMRKNLKADDYLILENDLLITKRLSLLKRLKIFFKYHIRVNKTNLANLIDELDYLFYKNKQEEIRKEIKDKEQYCRSKAYITKRINTLSNDYFKSHLYYKYFALDKKEFTNETYKRQFRDFTTRYPVILSTTHSLFNNAPKGFMFDYLIIDESSQVDLLSGVLSLNSAKNVIIVGDSRQLQQIDEDRLVDQSKLLAAQMDIPVDYIYGIDNSLLKSVKNVIKYVPTTLLNEHYRCVPDIINFCNQYFYDGKLVAMTQKDGVAIQIIKTGPGNHARVNPHGSGWYNQREIDAIDELLPTINSNSVGIITPFTYQAKLIKEQINSDYIQASTVHKFQGQERDEIILSFVANSLEKKDIYIENRLYDFLTNEKLLNVAISRAKNKLYLIVSDGVYHSTNNIIHDFILYTENLYGSSVTSTSQIVSVFDYLYSKNTSLLLDRFKDSKSPYLSEALFADLIDKVLSNYRHITYAMHVRLSKLLTNDQELSEAEKQYIYHPLTHVDFFFYNKISKEPLFAIEVDGVEFHEQKDKQLNHDAIKDKALSLSNIPIYRFKTNQSQEEKRLYDILKNYAH